MADWEKIIANIEKGEAKLKRREEIRDHLRWKVETSPRGDMRFNYGPGSKIKVYTEDEDRFLVRPWARSGVRRREIVPDPAGGPRRYRRSTDLDGAQAGVRRGRRIRPAAARDSQRASVPIRLVPQVPNGARAL